VSSELRIERGAGDELVLRLPSEERLLLRRLAGQVRLLLEAAPEQPNLRRLFPPAYEDAQEQAAYRELMEDELLAGRLRALEVLATTVDSSRLDARQGDDWLRALNDLRLVLGTRLDVTQETFLNELQPEDPRAPDLAIYAYLTWLQEQLVDALSVD
jgi:hypothetical protein